MCPRCGSQFVHTLEHSVLHCVSTLEILLQRYQHCENGPNPHSRHTANTAFSPCCYDVYHHVATLCITLLSHCVSPCCHTVYHTMYHPVVTLCITPCITLLSHCVSHHVSPCCHTVYHYVVTLCITLLSHCVSPCCLTVYHHVVTPCSIMLPHLRTQYSLQCVSTLWVKL